MYSQRASTSGIGGNLYETKLISLLYFRALNDNRIAEFQLASNDDKMGIFDDICFKVKVDGFDKPIAVFMQAQHRENKEQTLKIDLATYFNSYIKIRQLSHPSNDAVFMQSQHKVYQKSTWTLHRKSNKEHAPKINKEHTPKNQNKEPTPKIDLASYFNSSMKIRQHFHPSNDLFLKGTLDETECLFVIYTNARVDLTDASVGSGFSAKLNYLIDTGGTVKQPYKNEETLEYLTKEAVRYQMTALAERMVRFIYDEQNFQMILLDDLVIQYHVILGQKVFNISEIQPPQSKGALEHRIASFRQDFFNNNEECITLFKVKLYSEIIKKIKPQWLTQKQLTSDVLSRSTDYNEAVRLAAKELILSLNFKVPVAFGNKDLTMRGSNANIEKINHIASKINELLYNCEFGKIVTIDESLEHGPLLLYGGIAGAIGNVFVLDDDTKLMKITDNWESLGTLAKRLYAKLNSEIHNLHEYKFCIKVDKFPKLSFDCSEYEEKLARDFLNKLLCYCNQADEKGVEEILKDEIEDYQHNQPNYFQVKTDAIFSEYHATIQKWWTHPQQCSLTRERDLFLNTIKNIIKDSLMCSINLTYMNKLQQYNYTFTEESVKSLNLQDQHSSTVIVAENSILTVLKVMQHLKNKGHVVLDLEYIANLPTNDRNALRSELADTHIEKVFIIVCDKIDSRDEMKPVEHIAKAIRSKKTIIITNQTSLQIVNRYFPEANEILHDKKLSLIDLSEESQNHLFEAATAIFPGVEIKLNHLLRGWPITDPSPQPLQSREGQALRSSPGDGLAVPAAANIELSHVEKTTPWKKKAQQDASYMILKYPGPGYEDSGTTPNF